jgi:hypothetical protein
VTVVGSKEMVVNYDIEKLDKNNIYDLLKVAACWGNHPGDFPVTE